MPARTYIKRIQQQDAFLAAFADDPVVSKAARYAGIDKATVYRWRAADADFARRIDSAIQVWQQRMRTRAEQWQREAQAKRDEQRQVWLPAAQERAAYARAQLAAKRRRTW